MAVTIENIRVICMTPEGISLPAVRVDINVPGLYGLGCGTLSYRYLAVRLAVEGYLTLLLKGRNVENIEELWQLRISGFRSDLVLSRLTLWSRI